MRHVEKLILFYLVVILTGCHFKKTNDISEGLKASNLCDTVSFAMETENAVTITVPPPTTTY